MNTLQKHIIDNYSKYVGIFTKAFKSSEVARDGIHTTYINFGSYKGPQPDNIETFVYVAIKRMCLNETRQYKGKVEINTVHYDTVQKLELVIKKSYDPSDDIIERLTAEKRMNRVRKHFKHLGKKTEKIMTRHVNDDVSLIDIAKETKRNYNSTKKLYSHAIGNLQKLLKLN